MPDEPTTLNDLARRRRDSLRSTAVHVVGYPHFDPPKGLATAKRVANVLVDDDGEVREDNYDKLSEGDVAFWSGQILTHGEKDKEVMTLANAARVLPLAGIVVFSEGVPKRLEDYLDARVWARDGLEHVSALRRDQYAGEVYEVKLEGLQ